MRLESAAVGACRDGGGVQGVHDAEQARRLHREAAQQLDLLRADKV